MRCPSCGNDQFDTGDLYGHYDVKFKSFKDPVWSRYTVFGGKRVRAYRCLTCGYLFLQVPGQDLQRLDTERASEVKWNSSIADADVHQYEAVQTEANRIITPFLIVLCLPLFLGVCLFLINPSYIGRMLFSCAKQGIPEVACSQPMGWIMLLISGMLLLAANLLLLGVKSVYRNKPGVLWAVGLLITLLVGLPVLFVILLGPAILIILNSPSTF